MIDSEYVVVVEAQVLYGEVDETVVLLSSELENEENSFALFLDGLVLQDLAVKTGLVQNPEKRLQHIRSQKHYGLGVLLKERQKRIFVRN